MSGYFITDRHLGGYVTGGDPDTQLPGLWQWLVGKLKVESVLDVGCGDGAALEVFSRLGVRGVGVDGMPQADERIVQHDYTTGLSELGDQVFDLVWSCEFVEHVDERYVANFMNDFCRAPVVAMTHAVPGQTGWHHVNCQDDAYWVGVLASHSYVLDEKLTKQSRAKAKFHANPENYFTQSGLVFRRAE